MPEQLRPARVSGSLASLVSSRRRSGSQSKTREGPWEWMGLYARTVGGLGSRPVRYRRRGERGHGDSRRYGNPLLRIRLSSIRGDASPLDIYGVLIRFATATS